MLCCEFSSAVAYARVLYNRPVRMGFETGMNLVRNWTARPASRGKLDLGHSYQARHVKGSPALSCAICVLLGSRTRQRRACILS